MDRRIAKHKLKIATLNIKHENDKQRALGQMGNRIEEMRETVEKQSHKMYKDKEKLMKTVANKVAKRKISDTEVGILLDITDKLTKEASEAKKSNAFAKGIFNFDVIATKSLVLLKELKVKFATIKDQLADESHDREAAERSGTGTLGNGQHTLWPLFVNYWSTAYIPLQFQLTFKQ
eukprot:11035233-Ditylum_brightwellii.AAC.1